MGEDKVMTETNPATESDMESKLETECDKARDRRLQRLLQNAASTLDSEDDEIAAASGRAVAILSEELIERGCGAYVRSAMDRALVRDGGAA